MPEMTNLERLKASAQRALQGQTPTTLCAYSFAIDSEYGAILLKAHFNKQPSEADREDISIVETEIVADFPDGFNIKTELKVVESGRQPKFLGGGIAYRNPSIIEK